MSLEDRDWYRADLTRRQRRMRSAERRRTLIPLATAAASLAAVVAAAPLVMTPRITYAASWQALAERVVGNTHCTRIVGFVIYVRPRPCQ